MLGFFQVSHPVFFPPPSDVLDHISRAKVHFVGMDILNRLDGLVLVMAATHLLEQSAVLVVLDRKSTRLNSSH